MWERFRLRLGINDSRRCRTILFIDHLPHHCLIQGTIPFGDRNRRDPVADQIGDCPCLVHEPVDAKQENEPGHRNVPTLASVAASVTLRNL